MMSDSIVVKRLERNLRYKLTYVKIFESYRKPNPGPEVLALLEALIDAQQSAISPLSSFLRGQGASTQELALDEKLLSHAANRTKPKDRLQFIYDGLTRAVQWYKTQLLDRQMTADLGLQELLFELGELDAAKLWQTEVVMAMLRVSVKKDVQDLEDTPRILDDEDTAWRPRLVEDVGRPAWSGYKPANRPRRSRYQRKDRK
jgi:hypothetical protein